MTFALAFATLQSVLRRTLRLSITTWSCQVRVRRLYMVPAAGEFSNELVNIFVLLHREGRHLHTGHPAFFQACQNTRRAPNRRQL